MSVKNGTVGDRGIKELSSLVHSQASERVATDLAVLVSRSQFTVEYLRQVNRRLAIITNALISTNVVLIVLIVLLGFLK